MTDILRNDILSIAVDPIGAELQSITRNGIEYLWQGDEKFWNRRAPILFPVVGGLKDKRYTANGTSYSLNQHGFARDMLFTSNHDDNALRYTLTENEDTLPIYPYRFTLTVIYTLSRDTLLTDWRLTSPDENIYFSIGAHPAFNCPGEFTDYALRFERDEALNTRLLDGRLLGYEYAPLASRHGVLPLNYPMFDIDTLIFDTLCSRAVTLEKNGRPVVTVTYPGFPLLGIWTPRAPFLCIEPWYGIVDTADTGGDIKDKYAIQHLQHEQAFTARHAITVHQL